MPTRLITVSSLVIRFCALLVAGLAGCASIPVSTTPMQYVTPAHGYRFVTTPVGDRNSNSLLLVVTFSGGGSRAAALAYGVLETLSSTEIIWDGERRRLLDEVDVISSVSGGSVTAAYFALHGEQLFEDFVPMFLSSDMQTAANLRMANPLNWVRLASPQFGRSDLVAELFDDTLFRGATFANIVSRNRRPFVMLNATDMVTGHRFEFIQDQFDFLCTDMNPFPVARAVAASAAVPIALSPITIRNHADRCTIEDIPWITAALKERRVSSRIYYNATRFSSYRNVNERPFVHLVDGGLSDNLGLRGPLDSVFMQGGMWNLVKRLGITDVRKIVFVVVNASTEADSSIGRTGTVPGLWSVLTAAADIPLDRYTFETKELLYSSFKKWAEEIRRSRDDAAADALSFYLVDVDFEALQDSAERSALMHIPTRWDLPDGMLDRIRASARRLIAESPDMQRLLQETGGTIGPVHTGSTAEPLER